MTPDKPTLHLAPHENPLRRRTDLDGETVFFEAHCFGRVREFIGQSINEDGYGNAYFARLRDEDEPERGVFVCSGHGKGAEDWAQPYLDWGRCTRELVVQSLKEGIESNTWGRYFLLDKSLDLATADNGYNTLFLNGNGLGMFHKDGGSFARFRWNQPCLEELWNLPVLELLSQFVGRVQEQGSEPQFAVWWAALSDAEHFDLMFPLARGTYQEWQDVCRLVPTAFVQWPDNLNAKLYARFEVNGAMKSNFFEKSGRAFHQSVENAPIQKLARWLHNYFSPKRNDELCARRLCVQQWSKNTRAICEVRIDQPTQHERLEARLELRAWLQERATADECERFFAPAV